MKNLLTIATLSAVASLATGHAQQLSGAGASFPAPLYQRWAVEFNKVEPKIQVNYQSVGSGAGVKQFTAGTVDFGASDAAMKDEEIAKVADGVVQIPATAGSIVLAYNLPEVKSLNLSRAALVGILMGTITNWNDPIIAKANPGVTLPNLPVAVAYRSDGSGTTYVFTKFMSTISPEFKEKIGNDKTVPWPVGVGGKGNEGVTALVKQTPGTIGYVEYGYAAKNGISMANLENKAGKFVAPTPESAAAALAHTELPENLVVYPSDPAGAEDYPIVTYTWVLLYKKYADATKLEALKKFVEYGLTTGQTFSNDLGYVPLPENVVAKCKAALGTISAK